MANLLDKWEKNAQQSLGGTSMLDQWESNAIQGGAISAPQPPPDEGILSNIVKGAVSGGAGTIGGLAGWFGGKNAVTDYTDEVLQENQRSREHDGYDADYFLNGSGFAYDVGNLLGSFASMAPAALLVPGGAPATIASAGARLLGGLGARELARRAAVQAAQKGGGALGNYIRYGLGAGTAESLVEGGSGVSRAVQEGQEGLSPYLTGAEIAAKNWPLLVGSQALEGGILHKGFSRLGGKAGESLGTRAWKAPFRTAPYMAGEGLTESAQEVMQERAQEEAFNEPTGGFLPSDMTKNERKALYATFAPAALLGGIGGVRGSMRAKGNEPESKPAPYVANWDNGMNGLDTDLFDKWESAPGMTDLTGVRRDVVAALNGLANEYGGKITITGAAEKGVHTEGEDGHEGGWKVDIDKNLADPEKFLELAAKYGFAVGDEGDHYDLSANRKGGVGGKQVATPDAFVSDAQQPSAQREGHENAWAIYDVFKAAGYNDNAIAGILGRVQHEHNFDTSDVPEHEEEGMHLGGYGMFQWNGGRTTAFLNWAQENGLDPQSATTQAQYALLEAQQRGLTPEKMNQLSHEEAADLWTSDWEVGRPGDERKYAGEWLTRLQNGGGVAGGVTTSTTNTKAPQVPTVDTYDDVYEQFAKEQSQTSDEETKDFFSGMFTKNDKFIDTEENRRKIDERYGEELKEFADVYRNPSVQTQIDRLIDKAVEAKDYNRVGKLQAARRSGDIQLMRKYLDEAKAKEAPQMQGQTVPQVIPQQAPSQNVPQAKPAFPIVQEPAQNAPQPAQQTEQAQPIQIPTQTIETPQNEPVQDTTEADNSMLRNLQTEIEDIKQKYSNGEITPVQAYSALKSQEEIFSRYNDSLGSKAMGMIAQAKNDFRTGSVPSPQTGGNINGNESTENPQAPAPQGENTANQNQNAEPGQAEAEEVNQPVQQEAPQANGFVNNTVTTKKGKQFPGVTWDGRVEKDEWTRRKEIAKQHNGWWDGKSKSFGFRTEQDRENFLQAVNAPVEGTSTTASQPVQQAEQEKPKKESKALSQFKKNMAKVVKDYRKDKITYEEAYKTVVSAQDSAERVAPDSDTREAIQDVARNTIMELNAIYEEKNGHEFGETPSQTAQESAGEQETTAQVEEPTQEGATVEENSKVEQPSNEGGEKSAQGTKEYNEAKETISRALEEIKAGRSSVDELRREANRAYAKFVKSVDDDTTPESEELSKLISEVHKEVDKQKENALNGLLGAKTKDSTSTERDYHGFLDDKKPGAVAEIRRQLEKKDTSFGTGLLTTKHIVERWAETDKTNQSKAKGKTFYLHGNKVSKAVYDYYNHLILDSYINSLDENGNPKQEAGSNVATKLRERLDSTVQGYKVGTIDYDDMKRTLKKIQYESFSELKKSEDEAEQKALQSVWEDAGKAFDDVRDGALKSMISEAPQEKLAEKQEEKTPETAEPKQESSGAYTKVIPPKKKGDSFRVEVDITKLEEYDNSRFNVRLIAKKHEALTNGKLAKDTYTFKFDTLEAAKAYADEIESYIAKYLQKDAEPKQEKPTEAENNTVKEPAKEEGNNEQQAESGSPDGGHEGVRAGEGRSDQREGTGEVSGRDGRKGKGHGSDNVEENSEEPQSAGVRAGTELDSAASTGTDKRGNQPDVPLTEAQAHPSPTETPGHNYEIKDTDQSTKSEKVRFKQNVEAIKMLKQLEADDRMPTPAEQEILAGYNGWGGLKGAFIEGSDMNKEIRELLTEEEYKAARSTINDAFYTPPKLIRAIWEGISHLGFKGGRILDPSMGVGNFFGTMPRDMIEKSTLRGVELDDLTSRLGRMLYPGAFVEHKGFQKSAAADNYFDLAISNIPFGQSMIDGYQVHNFFFANGIDKVRPGGLMVYITSQGSLAGGKDAVKMRNYLAGQADLIAAYKLPSGVFSDAGTQVATDIVVFRKRDKDGKKSPYGQKFADVKEVKSGQGYYAQKLYDINEYFEAHPENILGEQSNGKDQWGNPALNVKMAEGTTLADVANDIESAMKKLPEDVYQPVSRKKSKAFDTASAQKRAAAAEKTRDYEYYYKDGKPVQNQNGQEVAVTGAKAKIVDSYLKLKNTLNALFAAESDPKATNKQVESIRKKLNKDYDAFVAKHGLLTGKAAAAFRDDPSAGMVQALEKPQEETYKDKKGNERKRIVGAEKADIFSVRSIKPVQEVTHVESADDALLASLTNKGDVDLDYMAGLMNSKPEKLVSQLKGKVFKNPVTEDYETREEYLSGNVREKLAQAKEAAKSDQAYADNAKELEKVVPEDLVSDEIYVNLGTPWIPVSDVQDFVNSITDGLTVKFSRGAALWNVTGWGSSAKYKLKGITLNELFDHVLNNKAIQIYDGTGDNKVFNKEKTDAANVAAEELQQDFRDWIWKDKEREKRLTRYYNDNYNNMVVRQYNGQHLNLHDYGMNAKITLKPHQKDVVWRMLQGQNTLIAHCVGAGKTFEMQAAGMEMRRLGIANKPMYCLPNNVVQQFAREFRILYPNAKLLVLQSNDLPAVEKTSKLVKTEDGRTKRESLLEGKTAEQKAAIMAKRTARNRMLNRIRTEDWDGIIISHNLFQRFPVTPDTAAAFIQQEIDNLEQTIREARADKSMDTRALSRLEDAKKNLEERLEDAISTDIEDIGVPFEELGVDQLFVDEADMFKNLEFATRLGNIRGLSNSKANRSRDMFIKTQWLTNTLNGRGVVFATGTPVSNTMSELYTMMRYLDMKGLKEKGLELFDNWLRTFGDIGQGIERKPTGDGFRKVTMIKRFINMAELTKMFRKFADVKVQEELNLNIPKLKDGKTTVVALEPDPKVVDYIKNVVPERVKNMKSGFKKEKGEDNMLSLTNDLRKLSLTDSKIEACADAIVKKYHETTDVKGTQLVFCDMGIPKAEKGETALTDKDGEVVAAIENPEVYRKLIEKLKKKGIPEKEVAFIQNYNTKQKRDDVFQKVDKGEVRILIGSTETMGAGTNCQKHLVALHDLDAPWRPRDLEQRHGRILRQGNDNKEVEIFNYVVKDSFDANMWEKLKNKAAIIQQAMSGDMNMRTVEDADLVTLSYAEVEGAATGNPLIKEQLQVQNDLTKYQHAQTAFRKKVRDAENLLDGADERVEKKKREIAKAEKDIAQRKDTKGDKFSMLVGKTGYKERGKADEALSKLLENLSKRNPVEIGQIGGFRLMGYHDGVEPKLFLANNLSYEVNKNSVQGIEYVLNHAPDTNLANLNAGLERMEKDIAQAEEIVKQENPYAEKVKALSDRLNQLNREIAETLVDDGKQAAETAPKEAEEEKTSSNRKYSLDNSDNRRYSVSKEELPTAHKDIIIRAINAQLDKAITALRRAGTSDSEIIKELQAENSNARQRILRQINAEFGRYVGENAEKHKHTLVQKNLEKHGLDIHQYSDGEIDSMFGTLQENARKVIDYANTVYKETAYSFSHRAAGLDVRYRGAGDIARAQREHGGHIKTQNSIRPTSRSDEDGFSNARSMEELKAETIEAFPGAKVQESGNKLTFTMPNGQKVTFTFHESITVSDEELSRAKREHGIDQRVTVTVEGYAEAVDGEGFGALSQGSRKGTGFHEAYHIAEAMAFTKKELADAKRLISANEEERADAYAKWKLERKKGNNFSKLWQKIADVTAKMAGILGYETKRNIFRKVESGEIYQRDNTARNTPRQYSVNASDNSTSSYKQRVKNFFSKSRATDTPEYRRMLKGMMEEIAGIKIRYGKIDPQMAAVYDNFKKVIRAKSANDWERVLPLFAGATLEKLGVEPNEKLNAYISDWIQTGAPNNNSREAEIFQKAMKDNPEVADQLIDLQEAFQRWDKMNAMERGQNIISWQNEEKTSFSDQLGKAYDQFIEELGPIMRLVQKAEKEHGKLRTAINPYEAFRLFRGYKGRAMTMIEGSSKAIDDVMAHWYPNLKWKGFKSIHAILDSIDALHNEKVRKEFETYCLACHVYDIHKANDLTTMEIDHQKKLLEKADGEKKEEIQAKIDRLEKSLMETPLSRTDCGNIIREHGEKYGQAQQDLVNYSNMTLAILKDSGVISEYRYSRILKKWPNYVPMFRVFDDNDKVQFGDSMKAMMGSKRDVIEPLQSIIRNTFEMMRKAEKNKAKCLLAQLARMTDVGNYIEEVNNSKPDDKTTIVFYEDGQKRYLQTDPAVVTAVNGMGLENSNMYRSLLRIPAAFARSAFTVWDPTFIVRNTARDVQDAFVYNKKGTWNPLTMLKDWLQAFLHVWRQDDIYWEWMSSGAAQASAVSVDRNYTQSTLDKMTKTRAQRWKNPKFLLLDTMQKLAELSEASTRIANYERVKKNLSKDGVEHLTNLELAEAAYESRDLMDFARGGKASRVWNSVSVFANPALQGWDKFYRTFKGLASKDKQERKEAMYASARLVLAGMLPALVLTLMNWDKDWWKEIPDWQKDTHWILAPNVRIPKGQDIGVRFFSSLIEKGLDSMYNKNPMTAKRVLKPVWEQIPDVMPTAMMPIIEAAANYSFFKDAPIVPKYQENLPAKLQYSPFSSGFAKFISEQLSDKFDVSLSPRQIDHVLTGLGGNVSRTATGAVDVARGSKQLNTSMEEMPILRGFMMVPYKNSATVEKFYKEFKKQQEGDKAFKTTHERMEGYSPAKYKRMNAASKKMSELNKKERKLLDDNRISPERKQELQAGIQRQRIAIAKRAMGVK